MPLPPDPPPARAWASSSPGWKGDLVRLLPEYEPPPLPVQLVTTSAQHLAPKVRAFLDHATRSFATLDVIRRWS